MKTIIDRLRTKSSSDLLRGGGSPVNGTMPASAELAQPSSNVTRLEKIFKTKLPSLFV